MVIFTPSRPRLASLLMWLLLLGAFPTLAQAPPGNALNFDGADDYIVSINSGSYFNYTVEAWVRTTNAATGDGGTVVSNYPNFSVGMYGGKARFRSFNSGSSTYDLVGTTTINDGKWHHVAAVMAGGINYNMTLYVDGVAEGSRTGGRTDVSSTYVGTLYGSADFWQGSIDEVRIWDGPHSAAEIKTFFNNAVPATQAGLLMNYTFDRGTAGGNNAGQTTEPNPVPRACGGCYTYTGTLYNFALSGSTSNLIESYALMQPTSLAATGAASGTSITATWTAPPVGTVSNYVLDCSTTADYSAGVTTVTPAGGTTSATITGRAVNTRYWLRLRADKTSVTGQGAYSRDVANLRTASGQTPPGNALAFDGTDDYVHITSGMPATGEFTLEGWVNPTAFSGGLAALVMADDFPGGAMHCQFQGNNLAFTINGNAPTDVVSASALPTGRWSHVAVVYSASARTVKFYVNGVLNTAATYTTAQGIAATAFSIGGWLSGSVQRPFNGKLDEIRLYNTTLTQAQVQADMRSTTAAVPASLVAYYDFDQGTAGGANTAQTTLVDRSLSYQDGTLTNFSLTGNATSNFVESYALVIPTLGAVTALSTTGFTANWTAPATGIVNNYVLDYSLSPTFATVAGTLSPAAGATSQAVSGLLPNRNYYYRLRADKTSGAVAGQGAYVSGTVRTASALTPPGNALAFDGSDDYVAVSAAPALNSLGLGSLTQEAWVYCTNLSPVSSIIRKGGDYNLVLQPGGLLYAEVWPGGTSSSARTYSQATTAIPLSRWTHVAATWDGTALRLYVNGAAVPFTQSASAVSTSEALQIGVSVAYGQPFVGRLDEVRIYSAALTPAQVKADMTSTSAAVPANLLLYYNFDQGTDGGSNAANTILTDQSPTLADGTLTNFALSSSNTTSNWVESYALVVPTLTASSGATATGFTANWTAPAIGSADNGYSLDVATSLTFAGAAVVSGSPFAVPAGATSQALTGLASGQTYYYRLRADKTSVTGQGAYTPPAQQAPFAPMPPPGNALAFDGSDDYVTGTNPQLPQGNAARTLEAWVLTTASGSNVIVNYGTATSNQRSGILLSNGRLYYVGESNDVIGNKVFNDGHWHHVAATYDGTTLKLYVDGVFDVSTAMAAFITTGFDWNIGKRIPPLTSTEQFNGRLDEVRVYNVALTQAQVQADMTSTSPAAPGSLVAYYNFDQGTANGANPGYTTLADQSANAATGTLTSFALTSGNTTSNWVESYALLQPTGLTASANTGTGFTASWTAPLLNGAAPAAGIVEGYVLEVSASSTFASGVTSLFPVSGYGSTSVAATGLTNGTNYYLRVRAEKANVTGQGDYSLPATTHTVGTDALLASLVPSAGGLSPTFAPGTLAYTLYVPASASTYTLTPTASNGFTTIAVNGTAVANGATSGALNVGSTATIVLTSEDLNTTRTYTVQAIAAPTYFRSVATGNWGDPATWEASYDGSTGWFAAPVAPTSEYAPTVNVRNGHTVTMTSPVSVKTATIESSGVVNTLAGQTLTIPSGATMTVNAGGVLSIGQLSGITSGNSVNLGTLSVASGGTLTTNGTVVLNTGSTATTFPTGAASFGAGSRLVLFGTFAALTIPVATWNTAATLELAGTANATTVATSLNGKTLGSLEVNLAGSGLHVLLSGAGTATLAGNLTVTSTGTGTLRLLALATTTGGALTINGNYVQNGGLVNGCAANNAALTAATTVAVNVGGNFTVASGSFTANQGYTTTATTIRPNPLTIGGDLLVNSGATFSLVSALAASNNTTSTAAANYTTSRVNLLGNFTNNGTFTTGNTAATNTGQQLYFTKTGVQTFGGTGTIGTTTNRVNATVNATSILDLGTNAFTGIGTFTTVSGSTLRLGSPDGISTSSTATGNVQNTGTRNFAAGTNVEFNGMAAQITGTGFPTLSAASTLSFNNAAGVTLSQALTTPGTLSFKQGVVTTTATNLLTLGTTATTTGTLDATATNTGRVAGPFKRWVAAATGSLAYPIGTAATMRPATISYTAAPTAGGTLMAEFVASPAGNQGLPLTENGNTATKGSDDGYWHFTAADGLTDGTYTATFTFNGISGVSDYSKLLLLKRPDAASDWALLGTGVATTGTNTAPVLSRTGLTGFSDFTAGLNAAPLPVELVSFGAQAQGEAVALSWRTASEKNSAYFEVQASADGRSFQRLGQVQAQGTTARATDYTFTDAEAQRNAPAGRRYYRLRQVDLDGTVSYSPVRTVSFGSTSPEAFSAAPVPFHDQLTLTLQLHTPLLNAPLMLSDMAGREVLRQLVSAPAGTQGLPLSGLDKLPGGVYLLRLFFDGEMHHIKVVKE